MRGGYSLVLVRGLLIAVASRCRAQAPGGSVVVAHGLSVCGSQAPERRLSSCGTQASLLQGMWFTWVRDQTHVSCIGKEILYHWTVREALKFFFIRKYSFLAQTIENLSAMRDTQVRSLGQEDSLEMTGYSSWGHKEQDMSEWLSMSIVEYFVKESFKNICSLKSSIFRDFPGGSVAKTPCSQSRGPGFSPWSGN